MTKSGKTAIFNRYFILLFLTSVCFCTATEMNNVVLPLYVTEDLGGTAATTGILTSIYTATSALSRPVNGILTDRHRRRTVMLIGCLLYAAGIFFCGLVPVLSAAFLARAVQGVGYSAASTANMAASNDVIPHEHLNEGVGYFGISQTLPSLFAPLLATTLISVVGNRATQFFIGSACVIATVVSLFVNYEKRGTYAVQRQEQDNEKKGAFVELTAIPSSLLEFGSLFFTTAIMVFISTCTKFGKSVYAIGSNEKAAKLSGINVPLEKVKIYALCGIMTAIGAIIYISRIGSMDFANAGSGYEMDAIAAVVVGGTSMAGGKGSLFGAFIGMLIIGVMNNILNTIGVPTFLCEAVKGLIIIFAVLLQKKDSN